MMQQCLHCSHAFMTSELSRDASKAIEAEREALGIEGVFFRCYACVECGHENLFLDVHRLEGESLAAFRSRRAEFESSIRQTPHESVEVAIVSSDAPDDEPE